jgi:hypothetical protein
VSRFILAGDCDCSSWLSEGHSMAARMTYLVRVRVVGGRALEVSKFEI